LAKTYDINPMDALHISAAILAKADEFITAEKNNKPLFNVNVIRLTIKSSHENN
jgi:hypothetical protein